MWLDGPNIKMLLKKIGIILIRETMERLPTLNSLYSWGYKSFGKFAATKDIIEKKSVQSNI